MRVLHLNSHSSGGSHEYAVLLSSALAEHGIESRVLCRDLQQPGKPFLDRVIRKAYVSFSTEPWHGTRRLLSPPPANELQAFDIVHLHTVADWFNVPSWLETLPSGIGVVITLHDMWHFTGGCFLYRGCDRFTETCAPCPILKTALNRILAKDEQRRKLQAYRSRRVQFVANSQWLGDLADRSVIVRACGCSRVIPPGIDKDVFTPRDKAQCRAELGIPTDAFVIAAGAPSLTDTNKNIRWLLEQLTRLPDREKLIVLLAGEGEVDIPAGINVRMIGGITDPAARAIFYGVADIFVSASLMETYGLMLVEAMSCGIPVVAFRVGGIPEAAPEGHGAILCAVGDGAALIDAITKQRGSSELRENLGRLAHETTRVRNSLTSFSTAFVQLYEQCVSSRQKAEPKELTVIT